MEIIIFLAILLSIPAVIFCWKKIDSIHQKNLKSDYKILYSIVSIIILTPIIFTIIAYILFGIASLGVTDWK